MGAARQNSRKDPETIYMILLQNILLLHIKTARALARTISLQSHVYLPTSPRSGDSHLTKGSCRLHIVRAWMIIINRC